MSTVTVLPSAVMSVPATAARDRDLLDVKVTSSPGREKALSVKTLPSHSKR